MNNNNKGITLIALVITIMLIVLIAGVTVSSGIKSIDAFKLEAFRKQLELIQENVNIVAKQINNKDVNYIDNSNNILVGIDVTTIDDSALISRIDNPFNALSKIKSSDYRYFNKEELKKINIEGIQEEYIINFATREVISVDGIRVGDNTYYILEQISEKYNIQYDSPSDTAPEFEADTQYLAQSCRIVLKDIEYSGHASEETGVVQYKLSSSQDWILASGNSFEVYVPGLYDVKLTDRYGSFTTKEVKVYVFSGLNLYLDGIKNTRNGTNATSTNWEDLSSNENDAIGNNMNTTNGYYSTTEKGYVFLENASYFETMNNIGITGDTTYTIETVIKPYSDSPIGLNTVLWWGSALEDVEKTFTMGYNGANSKFYYSYINNIGNSQSTHYCLNQTMYYAVEKVRTGAISTGNTDMYRMNYNGRAIDFVYEGTQTITANLVESKLQIGRDWQYNNLNKSFYGIIKAVRIYNRALRSEEISLNSILDAERYRFYM